MPARERTFTWWIWLAPWALTVAHAQELEPRAYSALPVGANFLAATYSLLTGDVLTDPSLPISDVRARISIYGAGYVRAFDLFGRTASIGIFMPFASADVGGNVFDAPNSVHRAGIGDTRMRLAVNFLGGSALKPADFLKRTPATTLGGSVTVIAPTGQFNANHLINIGANRWAVKPEIGLSQPLRNWFAEVSAGVWFFGDNPDFLGSNRRSQSPLWVFQLHAGYQFRPALWIATDVGFYTGGNTSVNGIANADRQQNSRYGITLSVPMAAGWSAKLGASKGFMTRAGGDYKALTLTLQYQWLDP
ncbi:transporter [Cupriavidus sp. WKF15]|uniref:transporter n=1 Tax=Cupriavidus sp. WKF15 TaxID=3032282 RepID=UPI0023E0A07F|nr:transporter [Cupriavidus sp. WKF15]WER50615.1 transporter [Cupriavidus sp. WKF15]